MSMDVALDLLYRGQTNVAVKAQEMGISLETMKTLFNQYVSERPVDPDIWQADVEMSWPWM